MLLREKGGDPILNSSSNNNPKSNQNKTNNKKGSRDLVKCYSPQQRHVKDFWALKEMIWIRLFELKKKKKPSKQQSVWSVTFQMFASWKSEYARGLKPVKNAAFIWVSNAYVWYRRGHQPVILLELLEAGFSRKKLRHCRDNDFKWDREPLSFPSLSFLLSSHEENSLFHQACPPSWRDITCRPKATKSSTCGPKPLKSAKQTFLQAA